MLTPEQVQGLQVAFEQMAEPVTEYLVRDVAWRVSEGRAAHQYGGISNMAFAGAW